MVLTVSQYHAEQTFEEDPPPQCAALLCELCNCEEENSCFGRLECNATMVCSVAGVPLSVTMMRTKPIETNFVFPETIEHLDPRQERHHEGETDAYLETPVSFT